MALLFLPESYRGALPEGQVAGDAAVQRSTWHGPRTTTVMGAAGVKLMMLAAALLGYGVRAGGTISWAAPSLPPASLRASDSTAGCPEGMARVKDFCIDRWEDYVVELDEAGQEHEHSPYLPVDGLEVRARTAAGVVPQGYISQVQAADACAEAGKRLCSEAAFRSACRGPNAGDLYPYGGQTRKAGYCNEGKGSMVPLLYGNDPRRWTYEEFNDPRLNQLAGGLAPTGSYPRCESPEGVWDCVGNLHEWTSDPPDAKGHGRFRGGFYGDAERNGHGCLYVTRAHPPRYHDYSTGFRCCADLTSAAIDPDEPQ